jgi:hypothetical protein
VIYDQAESLLNACLAHIAAADDYSGDVEHEAAVKVRQRAIEFLRVIAERDVQLAEMLSGFFSKNPELD